VSSSSCCKTRAPLGAAPRGPSPAPFPTAEEGCHRSVEETHRGGGGGAVRRRMDREVGERMPPPPIMRVHTLGGGGLRGGRSSCPSLGLKSPGEGGHQRRRGGIAHSTPLVSLWTVKPCCWNACRRESQPPVPPSSPSPHIKVSLGPSVVLNGLRGILTTL